MLTQDNIKALIDGGYRTTLNGETIPMPTKRESINVEKICSLLAKGIFTVKLDLPPDEDHEYWGVFDYEKLRYSISPSDGNDLLEEPERVRISVDSPDGYGFDWRDAFPVISVGGFTFFCRSTDITDGYGYSFSGVMAEEDFEVLQEALLKVPVEISQRALIQQEFDHIGIAGVRRFVDDRCDEHVEFYIDDEKHLYAMPVTDKTRVDVPEDQQYLDESDQDLFYAYSSGLSHISRDEAVELLFRGEYLTDED